MSLSLDGATGNITGLNVLTPQLPLGAILQVLSATKTDTTSTTNTTATDIPGLSVTITPTSSSTKMLLLGHIGTSGCDVDDFAAFFYFAEGGTTISGATGDAASSRTRMTAYSRPSSKVRGQQTSLQFLHSHGSSSSLTYTIQFSKEPSGGTLFLNRVGQNPEDDVANRPRTISTLTVLEVEA